MLDGELISDTSHWVREVLEADSQGVTYSASVEPSEVCLYRVSETGVEKLSPSGHVATAKMRAGTTVLRAGLDRKGDNVLCHGLITKNFQFIVTLRSQS